MVSGAPGKKREKSSGLGFVWLSGLKRNSKMEPLNFLHVHRVSVRKEVDILPGVKGIFLWCDIYK